MRSLKFRVWNNRYNEFIRPDYELIGFCYPLDGRIAALTTSGEPMEDWDIEQYTGLKDKNGKEIYEGDIVLVANMGRIPFVVIYREEDCSFVANNEALMDYFHLFSGLPKCYEKIGNIHENHELLEHKG